jgi:hypothetical protein
MATPPAGKEAELEYRLRYKRLDALVIISKSAIKYGFFAFCAYYAFRAIEVLAGKTTVSSIVFSILANFTVRETIYIILAGGGIIYGIGEREMRRRNIRRITDEKNALERILDANRSSSELTTRGTTKPEDRRK